MASFLNLSTATVDRATSGNCNTHHSLHYSLKFSPACHCFPGNKSQWMQTRQVDRFSCPTALAHLLHRMRIHAVTTPQIPPQQRRPLSPSARAHCTLIATHHRNAPASPAPLVRRSADADEKIPFPITKHSAIRSRPCISSRKAFRSPTMGSTTGIEPINRQLPPIESVQAVLFDVDGTLTDSDPLHYVAFRDMLAEMGYNGGIPITEEFYSTSISGNHNTELGVFLFPDWDQPRRDQWLDDKEALFRRLAAKNLEPVAGLHRLTEWLKAKGFRCAAVTNAPRSNAEQMIAAVGLTDFFEHLVIGGECKRAKPFPDPYLNALEHFGVSAEHAFAFEDSPAGLGAAVAAGLPVVGITTGNPGPALVAAGAAFLIKDFDDPALWSKLEKEAAMPSQ